MTINEIKALLAGTPDARLLAELAQDSRQGVRKLLEAYYKKQERLAAEKERFAALLRYEKTYYDRGARCIAGVDEAGRGPLAGPLVVAAVILPGQVFIDGLNDSKQLSAAKREKLYEEIMEKATDIAVAVVSVSSVDTLNIYRATQRAMAAVLQKLRTRPDVALIDAMPVQAEQVECVSLVHGDALSASIAAASIIAKVTRDRIMAKIAPSYPAYGFEHNKGYGSKEHMQALRDYGATVWHRRSYEPVKSMNLAPAPVREDVVYLPLEDGDTYEPQD